MQQLDAIPVLSDNYVWVMDDGRHALVVDPGESEPVADRLRQRGLALTAILITHHHPDHIAGLAGLKRAWPEAIAFGPGDDRIAGLDRIVGDGDAVAPEYPRARFDVLAVPGHTRSHIAFHGERSLFCGDTLFSAGCGRLFEGTPEQMAAALRRLAALPADTRVCCGHEYTASNCRFARHVEPDNAELAAYESKVQALRADGRPTLPSRIDLELAINPFLRTGSASVRRTLERMRGLSPSAGEVQVFAALRAWKDAFRV